MHSEDTLKRLQFVQAAEQLQSTLRSAHTAFKLRYGKSQTDAKPSLAAMRAVLDEHTKAKSNPNKTSIAP